MNDPTIYTEAAIRHMPELLRAVVSHAVKCEDTDCGVCAVFNAILITHGQQNETRRADEATYRRQEEVREKLDRQLPAFRAKGKK